MRNLRQLERVKWQDRVTNAEVLRRCSITGIEAMIIKSQLRWSGHIARMLIDRIPKQIFYGEVESGQRPRGGQMKRYRDVLKSSMKASEINPDSWESDTLVRPGWRKICHTGMATFEANRLAKLTKKRTRRIKRFNNHPQLDAETFTCAVCGRVCRSRIGLHSHQKKHSKV